VADALERIGRITHATRDRLRATLPAVKKNRDLASWLISNRNEIEAVMRRQLGPAAPAVASPEAEALRRFRSFTSSALMHGRETAPALDGLRVNQRRTEALLAAWVDAAVAVSGGQELVIREPLTQLVMQFRVYLRGTATGRKSRGTPRAKRRAVIAAIDRLSEGFLAIDTDTGIIEDANPAAGALLGLNRDALLGVDAMSFVPQSERSHWWGELDAVGEGVESNHFDASMVDTQGIAFDVAASVTRFATRGKTLALILMRNRAAQNGQQLPQRVVG
jgi:PAS domain-containing protein